MTTNDHHYDLTVRNLAHNLFGVAHLSFECLAWCVDSTARLVIALLQNEFVLMTGVIALAVLFLRH